MPSLSVEKDTLPGTLDYGPVRVATTAMGYKHRALDLASVRAAMWEKMLAIHLDGAFLTTRACVPHMQASGRGGSIPAQAAAQGISEDDVIRKVMLRETVDGEFTTVQDVAELALRFASFGSNALTGQSLVASHGWCMQ